MNARLAFALAAGITAALFLRLRDRFHAADLGNGRPGAGLTHDQIDARRLVGIIAHELRTPTSVILGYQELLAAGLLGPVNDRTREALERIRRAATQLRDLTDGLQILTGDVPDRQNPDRAITDLRQPALRAIEAARADAEARGVNLSFNAAGPAPVIADPDAIERLFDLLLSAALRAGPQHDLQLVVHDRNHDLTIETVDVSFDPASEGAALLTPPDRIASGLGLRLAIAQRIATSMGGSLDLATNGQLQLRLPSHPGR